MNKPFRESRCELMIECRAVQPPADRKTARRRKKLFPYPINQLVTKTVTTARGPN